MKASLASLGPVLIGAGLRPQGRKPFAVWGPGDPHFSGAGQVCHVTRSGSGTAPGSFMVSPVPLPVSSSHRRERKAISGQDTPNLPSQLPRVTVAVKTHQT